MERFCALWLWLPLAGLAPSLLPHAAPPRALAAEPVPYAELLATPIVGPEQGLADVVKFTARRVQRLPEFRTVREWESYRDRLRNTILEQVVFRGVPNAWREPPTHVVWGETMAGGPGYHIRKLRYEVLPGMWMPALLYEPDDLVGPMPVFLNVNGHTAEGKAYAPKQLRCINLAKRGIISLNPDWLGMGQLRTPGFAHGRSNQLDLCGTAGLAVFYLVLQRGLDVLLAHEHADPARVGVAGLSGGGWQTIMLAALDPRVTLCNPVAGYSSFLTRAEDFSDLGDSEQTPVDLASIADYTHLTAMLAPRPALLTYNAKDECCFRADHALAPLLNEALPLYRLYGYPWRLRSHVNEDPGTHNFDEDNREALYRLLADFFFANDPSVQRAEIPSAGEVKTADELHVPLPEENADFQTLALTLARELPRTPTLPDTAPAARAWQADARRRLADVVRLREYAVSASVAGSDQRDGVAITRWTLRCGQDWTLPAVEFAPPHPKGTLVLAADEGRASLAAEVERGVNEGWRVVALDPFYLGELNLGRVASLFALFVSSVGDRPVGVQASQLAAVCRWLSGERRAGPVALAGAGERTSLAVLVAAAVEPRAVSAVRVSRTLGSLKEAIEQNLSVGEAPELFCFGLLEQFDILQLAALTAPRTLTIESASQRVRQELAPLERWFALLGGRLEQ
jgi:dienelactone hydrolase